MAGMVRELATFSKMAAPGFSDGLKKKPAAP
jgi:hypothetical protein